MSSKGKKIKKLARQGDLLFVKKDELPEGAKPAEEGPILAHGEVTGHKHVAEGANVAVLDVPEGSKHVEAKEPWTARHDEHDPVFLDKGIWEIRRQREYFPDEIRQVVD